MPEETITISKSEYDSLKEDELWLRALEDAGVDNWRGVDYAKDTLREWQDEESDD
ncbi:hypothetical protein PXH69_24240 [Rhodococcus qingshengii]|uniref:Uncharacterized protein n=1 Tax=Rhodococcus qingshengii TaxID=334542 RepID=A0AAW6LRJ3_RHOSG|nr:hypothetical protein [Rhodococcus qingshengii]MDE8648091.1 hypothetical protein [Rhodococcus qingshengii]